MKNATEEHSTNGITEIVPVRKFRSRVEALERKVNVGLHATVDHAELMRWADECRSIARKVTRTGCTRATRSDWDRREAALDRSASELIKVAIGETRRRPVTPALRVVG